MRRALIVFLAVLILVSGCYLTAWALVGNTETKVSWQEHTLFGDKSEVANLQVTGRNTMSNRLLWESTGSLGQTLSPDTDFTFSNQYIRRYREPVYNGIEMYPASDLYGLKDEEETEGSYVKERFPELIRFVEEAYASVEPGDPEAFFTVDMREHTDYYLFNGSFYLPNCSWGMWNLFDGDWYYDVPETVYRQIHDYFRIPIVGEYSITFSVDKRFNGSTSMSGQTTMDYEPFFQGCANEKANYFSFCTHDGEGAVADTSLIPGGYGIYKLNYSHDADGKFHMGEPFIEMVFPLDPQVKYAGLDFSDDEKHLYLHTVEDGWHYRTVIDLETMTQLQKFPLRQRREDSYYAMNQYDDFLVIVESGPYEDPKFTLSLFSEDARGLYTHEFTVPMDMDAFSPSEAMDLMGYKDFHMDYNGETLAIGQNIPVREEEYRRILADTCDFYIVTYGASGMTYAGLYEVNLAEINTQSDRYDGAVGIFQDAPLEINWQ